MLNPNELKNYENKIRTKRISPHKALTEKTFSTKRRLREVLSSAESKTAVQRNCYRSRVCCEKYFTQAAPYGCVKAEKSAVFFQIRNQGGTVELNFSASSRQFSCVGMELFVLPDEKVRNKIANAKKKGRTL
ncbi:MAG: hypothetical protein ACI4W6_01995, partial [Acutalibacteraceae bacterium]